MGGDGSKSRGPVRRLLYRTGEGPRVVYTKGKAVTKGRDKKKVGGGATEIKRHFGARLTGIADSLNGGEDDEEEEERAGGVVWQRKKRS